MEIKELGRFFQGMYRTGYCMDYLTFCELMHYKVENAYTKGKWEDMQKNFAKWFSYLDDGEAHRYVAYCICKSEA